MSSSTITETINATGSETFEDSAEEHINKRVAEPQRVFSTFSGWCRHNAVLVMAALLLVVLMDLTLVCFSDHLPLHYAIYAHTLAGVTTTTFRFFVIYITAIYTVVASCDVLIGHTDAKEPNYSLRAQRLSCLLLLCGLFGLMSSELEKTGVQLQIRIAEEHARLLAEETRAVRELMIMEYVGVPLLRLGKAGEWIWVFVHWVYKSTLA